ncbi:tetratricopeptide repeat protein (plasmid) [Streptomyces sp. P8-A8]|uniref:tetratricopeptide repeat protein n=1 Tax=Streptomyces sp. P8-A8 TaxID=3029759 RepID=UPI0036D7763B
MSIGIQRSMLFAHLQDSQLAQEAARLSRLLSDPAVVRRLGGGDIELGWRQVDQINAQLRVHLDGLLASTPPEDHTRALHLAGTVEAVCVVGSAHQSRVLKDPGECRGYVIVISAITLGLATEIALQLPAAYASGTKDGYLPRTRADEALKDRVLSHLHITAPGREEPVHLLSLFGAAKYAPGIPAPLQARIAEEERRVWIAGISFVLQHELGHIWQDHFKEQPPHVGEQFLQAIPPAMQDEVVAERDTAISLHNEVAADCGAATALVNYFAFVHYRAAMDPDIGDGAIDPRLSRQENNGDPFPAIVRLGVRLMIEAIEAFYTAILLLTEYAVHMGDDEDILKRSDLSLRRHFTRDYLGRLCDTYLPEVYGFQVRPRDRIDELHDKFLSEIRQHIWDLTSPAGMQARQEEIQRWERDFSDGKAEAGFKLGRLYAKQNHPAALVWFMRAAKAGHRGAASQYALWMDNLGFRSEAEHWYRVAASHGFMSAAHNLGVLLAESGRAQEGYRWLRKAAEAGNAVSAYRLGAILCGEKSRELRQEGERWLAVAAERGVNADSGPIWVRMSGETNEAEHFYRAAALAGRPEAYGPLGVALYDRGSEEAEGWLRKGSLLGDVTCMAALGALLSEQGDAAEAEQWLTDAAEAGSAEAALSLGVLLNERENQEAALDWWRRAGQLGNPEAAHNVSVALMTAGKPEEAVSWMRKAAEGGVTYAAFNLALVMSGQGDSRGAETWLRQAASNGHNGAAYNLALARAGAGRMDEAEVWYRQAALHGDADAANNLGVLLVPQDRPTEAEFWIRQAVRDGHANAVANLGRLLVETGRNKEGLRLLSESAEAGNIPAAYTLGRISLAMGRTRDAERWWRVAAKAGFPGAAEDLASLRTHRNKRTRRTGSR